MNHLNHRPLHIVVVAVLSLFVGACAGRIQVASVAIPSLATDEPSPVPITANMATPEALSIRTFSLADLVAPQAAAASADETASPPACDILKKIDEAQDLLASVSLAIGSKEYRYKEVRANRARYYTDPEKQIALALLSPQTCTLQSTIITKRGDQLLAPSGYSIEPVKRANGIRWNNWATDYQVNRPDDLVVIGNQYPYVESTTVSRVVKNKTGKLQTVYTTVKTVVPIFYTGYNSGLHLPQLVDAGPQYLSEWASRAYGELRRLGVMSRAYPETLLADVLALKPEFAQRRVPIEHMDLTEFLLDPAWTAERIFVVIGANRDRMGTYTCSSASACGPLQYTRGTWSFIARLYPTARLPSDFMQGARDAIEAMKAALLLDDYNLSQLRHAFPSYDFASDPALEEYLAAAYNTGVTRVISVLKIAFAKHLDDWTLAKGKLSGEHLVAETKGYIAKLRYLRDQWPARQLTRANKPPKP